MSRRGRSGPTISLFSFQDIITSVTAIVTVITLLLALDLVQRHHSNSGDSSVLMASELVTHLQRSEAELAELRSMTDSTDDLVRAVAATSPAELKNEIARRESVIIELQVEQVKLQQQNKNWQAREKEGLTRNFDLDPLKEETSKTELKVVEIERQIAEETSEKRPIFTLPRGENREGWLAVIDAHKISMAPLGRPAIPLVFANKGLGLFGSSAVNQFEKWLDERRLAAPYFLLLIRPDACTLFDEIQRMMEKKSIAHGFDLVDSEQTLLHSERGAAP